MRMMGAKIWILPVIECCEAAHGSTSISTSVLPSVHLAILRIRTSVSVFVAPVHHSSEVLVSVVLKTEARFGLISSKPCALKDTARTQITGWRLGLDAGGWHSLIYQCARCCRSPGFLRQLVTVQLTRIGLPRLDCWLKVGWEPEKIKSAIPRETYECLPLEYFGLY